MHGASNRTTCPTAPRCGCATGPVIGYTLSLVADDERPTTGAALFFKDLTRVEQLEERERLRDRLAALGEMAAAIAHEVKNPLAGIEVMAGLLKRRLRTSPDAQSMLTDIINEAKMANAIVHEVLEFVRPIRLQVETRAARRRRSRTRSRWRTTWSREARSTVSLRRARGPADRSRAIRTSCGSCSRTC